MKGLKGNKRRGSHTTAIEAAERLVRRIQKDPDLTGGIRLGQIKVGGRANGEKRVKALACPAGIDLQIKDGTGIQALTLFTKNTKGLMATLRQICKEEHFILSDQTDKKIKA